MHPSIGYPLRFADKLVTNLSASCEIPFLRGFSKELETDETRMDASHFSFFFFFFFSFLISRIRGAVVWGLYEWFRSIGKMARDNRFSFSPIFPRTVKWKLEK